MVVLAVLCVCFGVFYHWPLKHLIYPALNIEPNAAIFSGNWDSTLATALIVLGVALGLIIVVVGMLARKARVVPTWTCGEVQDSDEIIIPGTHFYKTVSNMRGLKELYKDQEKGYFDLYDQSGRVGGALTGLLRWMHSGVLPTYLTWVTLGLLIILLTICRIW
jgi:hypothetical protein